jgi:glutathione S-transferase
MYRAPGSIYGSFGSDRKAALTELLKQLQGIETTLQTYRDRGHAGPFLGGNEISLADATLFPTMLFCDFMLPQFFNMSRETYMGKNLLAWWDHMSTVECAVAVKEEMMPALLDWVKSGRFTPIVAENVSI